MPSQIRNKTKISFRPLTDLPEEEEEVAESWEDIPEKETEPVQEPIDASWQIPQQEEGKLEDLFCTSNDIPEVSSSNLTAVEEACEKDVPLVWHPHFVVTRLTDFCFRRIPFFLR